MFGMGTLLHKLCKKIKDHRRPCYEFWIFGTCMYTVSSKHQHLGAFCLILSASNYRKFGVELAKLLPPNIKEQDRTCRNHKKRGNIGKIPPKTMKHQICVKLLKFWSPILPAYFRVIQWWNSWISNQSTCIA